MTPEEKVARAESAEALLANPLLKKSIQAVKDELYRTWMDTSPSETEAREHLWRMTESIGSVERVLIGYIQTGKITKAELLHKEATLKARSKHGNRSITGTK